MDLTANFNEQGSGAPRETEKLGEVDIPPLADGGSLPPSSSLGVSEWLNGPFLGIQECKYMGIVLGGFPYD